MPLERRGVQRRRSMSSLRLHVRAERHQRLDRLHVPTDRRIVQRRPSMNILRLHVRA